MTDLPRIRIRGSWCGTSCAVYVYQTPEGEFQCPICMRLLTSESEAVDHTTQEHHWAVKGPQG